MSTLIRRSFPQVLSTTGPLLVLLVCFLSSNTRAQIRSVEIRVIADAEPRINVDAECAPSALWSFTDSYAGIVGLGSRVVKLKAFAANGSELSVRQLAPGQFESATAALRFSYQLNLAPPSNPLDAAKVSWLTGQGGLLMLRDMLPATYANRSARETDDNRSQNLRVAFKLPSGWRAFENGTANGATEFEAANSDTAGFAIG